MVARYAGASLGLLAFAVAAAAGILVRNPVTVTLSRSILALFVFFFVGMALGSVAQLVLNEHERKRRAEIRERYRDEVAGDDPQAAEGTEPVGEELESIRS